MSWFKKKPNFGFKIIPRKREAPDGQWLKCDGCGEILYARELERTLHVCAKCGYHFRLGARDYIRFLTDSDSFESRFDEVISTDPLAFKDSKRYSDRLKENRKKTQLDESVLAGVASIEGHRLALGVMDFAFMGGTLGSAAGERLSRLIRLAVAEQLPLVIVSTSGGARMQEGILSLMQMAKTAGALAEHYEAKLLFISILLNPTTAGVAASYAALGDVIIAEPGARIGFAGPRVIQQTINQELPEGFQTSEFVLEHGMLDMIVERQEMRATVGRLLDMVLVPLRTPRPAPAGEPASGAADAAGGESGESGDGGDGGDADEAGKDDASGRAGAGRAMTPPAAAEAPGGGDGSGANPAAAARLPAAASHTGAAAADAAAAAGAEAAAATNARSNGGRDGAVAAPPPGSAPGEAAPEQRSGAAASTTSSSSPSSSS